ncbi:MAG: SUMF1/EgtB/PvdO family nonheme iron enzyme [Thermodesulfobacteriota bacterium]|nr:SUMF1/EgtB/PvdO family nonheme iron enzyme [Thermodesulfobacteriota bacterium]
MVENEPVRIISDNPEKDSIAFGFHAYALTIADLISNRENKTPLVIGIYGSWGSGKTTLMELVRTCLTHDRYKDDKRFRATKTVWFQAWKYGNEDEILAALIEEIFRTMKQDGFFEACKAKIEELVQGLKPSKVLGAFAKLVGADINELFTDLEYKEKLGFYDTFQDFFDSLLWDYLKWRSKKTCSEQTDDAHGVLVVFIDDLDRCPNDRIVRVLETIKLFMDKEGCVFVIGAANEIIEKALAKQYGEDTGRFMDKIVQVTFNLPQIQETDFKPFIEKISPDINEKVSSHLPLIIPAMQNNPRQMKRFLNNLSLQDAIQRNKRIDIAFDNLLCWSIIEYAFPPLWYDVKDNPNVILLLKDHIIKLEERSPDRAIRELSDEDLKDVPRSLWDYVKNRDLTETIKSFTGTVDDIRQLICLSGIVESTEDAKMKQTDTPKTGLNDMVEVPAGEFQYGYKKIEKEIQSPFFIDVYPVTNDQYERFMKEGGYTNDALWSPEGLQWRKKDNITQPKYWDDDKWNKEGHPVVGVSWYEAEAYANWAGKRLPTEEEWERAARGTDGREYPWGDVFDKERCNSEESGIGRTTRVTRYPNGTSPDGCYDMAGNVWEWTSSYYTEEGAGRVFRGGGWFIVAQFLPVGGPWLLLARLPPLRCWLSPLQVSFP